MRHPILILFFLTITASALAQMEIDFDAIPTEKPPLPSGDLVRSLGENEFWTITFQYLDENKYKQADIQSALTLGKELTPEQMQYEGRRRGRPSVAKLERLAPFMMLRLTKRNEGTATDYYSNGYDFYKNTPTSLPTRIEEPRSGPPGGGPPPFIDQIYFSLKKNKFVGFNWISPDHYLGVMPVEGIPCMVFEDEDRKAWVDLKKRTPVFWKQGDEIRKFIMNRTSSSIDIPANVMEEMKRKQERRQQLDTIPVFPR